MRSQYVRFVNEHSRALLRYSLRRLSDAAGCEDVVAETFLIVWRRWEDLPAAEKELPWLYSIAFHVLSNQRRSRDRRDRLHQRLSFERDPQLDGSDAIEIDTKIIFRALAELSVSDRELLEYVYWEKLSYRDIAFVVGVSENAIGIRINRAKVKLRTLLALPQEENPRVENSREELES